ncbi:MAG: protein-export chaperone SecB [Rhodanobacteraceae bacterium]
MIETPVNDAVGKTGGPGCPVPRKLYTRRITFDAPAALEVFQQIGDDWNQLQVHRDLSITDARITEDAYEVVLRLRLTGVLQTRTAYVAEVHQAGIFELTGSGANDQPRLLNTDCARVLFPLAQQVAGNMIRRGDFPSFQLPPVDFDAMRDEHRPESVDATSLSELQQFWKALTRLMAVKASSRLNDFRPVYAESLVVAQMARDALPAADQVLARAPSQPVTLEMLGAIYTMNNAQQRAVDVYRYTVSARPKDARAHYNLATSLMFTGDLAGAEREIGKCLELQPTFWDAYTVLSRMRRQSAQRNHVANLQALLDKYANQSEARQCLNMALAKEYEDVGDYTRAFEHLVAGNAAGRARLHYDSRQDAALFDAVMRHAPAAQPAGSGYDADEPVFVFGMPRSGTTLVERILSSHPEVTSAGELKQFGVLLKYMSGSTTADLLDVDTVARCRNLDWKALGERYLVSTRPLSGQTPRFIDKFPHHFLYVAYIANALPRARIICVRRNPMDTCLGNFRQGFSEASPFHRYAFDLLDIGRYYAMFDRLMAHWQHVFPGRILDVSYESLIQDQQAGTRAMLDFCGLHWDPVCLSFDKNPAPVDSASAVQVRSPIYHNAVGRWRHYEEQLTPLRDFLVEAGIAVPLP